MAFSKVVSCYIDDKQKKKKWAKYTLLCGTPLFNSILRDYFLFEKFKKFTHNVQVLLSSVKPANRKIKQGKRLRADKLHDSPGNNITIKAN